MAKPEDTKTEATKTEAPKAEAPKAAKAAPPPTPERSYRDPRCLEQMRHISNCDCVGAARQPIIAT